MKNLRKEFEQSAEVRGYLEGAEYDPEHDAYDSMMANTAYQGFKDGYCLAQGSPEAAPVSESTPQIGASQIQAAINKLRAIQRCHPDAVQTLIEEGEALLTEALEIRGVESVIMPKGWRLQKVVDEKTTISIHRTDSGHWCGGGIQDEDGASGLRYAFLNDLVAANSGK